MSHCTCDDCTVRMAEKPKAAGERCEECANLRAYEALYGTLQGYPYAPIVLAPVRRFCDDECVTHCPDVCGFQP